MVAARVREMYDRAAKERQKEAGKQHGRGKEKVVEKVPQPNDGAKSRDLAGKAVGVNGKYVGTNASGPPEHRRAVVVRAPMG